MPTDVKLTVEAQLKLISRAWGKQTGYVFFPWIDGSAEDKAQRVRGYNEGPAFAWPADRERIQEHLTLHKTDDLYWCPSIFEKKVRQLGYAMDEHALWADLDEVNPETIDPEFKPTIAWESSPGRYQGLWLITGGDLQGASWPGNENQRLTYYLGADHSGWDTTQLLRIPGWDNHKPEYKDANGGKPVPGRLLWYKGRRYLPDHFEDLPEVRGSSAGVESDALEEAIDAVDRMDAWGKARLKVSKDVRELVSARSTGGSDRSDKLWQIERDLADAGLTVPEIVSIVRETVWNKFSGRNDELRRLVTEASKAVAERTPETIKAIERAREDKPRPGNLFTMVKEAKPPVWLVKDILTEASCGFFAGQPKSFKSWSALDLAISIATGADFLNYFPVLNPGPVLYIQEEDPLPTLKDRVGKIAPQKTQDKVSLGERGEDGLFTLVWAPADENEVIPKINAIVREQFTISDPGWQAWLDEMLAEGYGGTPAIYSEVDEDSDDEPELISAAVQGEPYKAIVIDPLMMVAGDVEENRAQEMTEKIFKPLKVLAEKHQVAVQIVHHMRKGREGDTNTRGGQMMLGSVANHAWSESSLYFTHGKLGAMLVETESKAAPSARFEIKGLKKRTRHNALTWEPEVSMISDDAPASTETGGSRARGASTRRSSTGTASRAPAVRIGQGTRRKLARMMHLPDDASQTEIREAWENAGNVWGEWDGVVHTRDGREYDGVDSAPETQPRQRGRKPEPDPAALKALRKLTARKAKAYTTHEIKDEMAKELGVKPTQTIYLRAYQQLKKLWDNDEITRIEKDWVLKELDADALENTAIEELM